MTGYHLNPLRSRGWFRVGSVLAILAIPETVILHALGYFSSGWEGVQQAGEFFLSDLAIAAIIGMMGRWMIRGFVVRDVVEGEDIVEHASSSDHPANHRPAQAPHRSSGTRA